MPFTAKKIEENGPALGQKLREAREAAEVELGQLAKELKVRLVYLERLENNDYQNLPADVYIKGFLKKYAQFFKMEVGDLFAEYELERKRVRGLAVLASYSPLLVNKSKSLTAGMVISGQTLTFSGIFLIVLIVGGYFFYQLDFLFGSPKLNLFFPKADLITQSNKIEFIGRAEPNSSVAINGQQVYIDRNGDFREELILNQGLNTIELKVKNRFEKTTTVIRKIIREQNNNQKVES